MLCVKQPTKARGKRLALGALAAVLALAMLTGCNGSGDSDSGSSNPGSSSGTSTLTRYKEPITLTWQTSTSDDYPLDSEGLKEVMDKVAEATNVTVEWVPVPASDANQIYTTTLLSGKSQWPNLITKDLGTINQDGVLGAFVDLTPYLEEKMPNVYERLNSYDRWGDMVNLNSAQIFGVPRVGQQICSQSWMIRKDWLDICGLEEPTTVEEFADALRAFKEKNPGNAPEGYNYPFTARGNPQQWMSTVFGSWGMNSIYYTEFEDGTIELNLRMDEFRECMQYWHQLYEEGLIDPEVVIGDANRWTMYMNNSYSGATIDYTVRTQQFTNAAQNPAEDAIAAGVEPNPDAELIGLAPLTSGSRTTATIACNDPLGTGTAVGIMSSSTDEEIEAAMCLLNYIYSDEGSELLSWGIDGVSYNGLDSDGNPNWVDDLLNNYSIPTTAKYGIQLGIARPVTQPEIDLAFPGLAKEAALKNEGHFETRHSTMYLTDAEWTEHGDIFTQLSNLYIQACSEFLTGARTLDDAGWDQFQADLDALNVDRYMELNELGIKNAQDMLADFTLG